MPKRRSIAGLAVFFLGGAVFALIAHGLMIGAPWTGVDGAVARWLHAHRHPSLTTFMLAVDPPLLSFVEELTRLNHGRLYQTDPDSLGTYVYRDFIRNRRRRVH